MSEHTPLTEEWAIQYARTYWQHGNEPESQAALHILADTLAARTSTATADTPRGGHFPTTPVQCSCGWRETDPGAGSWADHFAATADTGLRERVEALAEHLRAAREERGLSYREAAVQIGCTPSTVHKIEHGGDPRWAVGLRVLAWLDATPASTEDRADNEGTREPVDGHYCPACGCRITVRDRGPREAM